MNCEVVAVGTELLLGQIVDTNSSWIGEQLALAGIDSFVQTKVGDNWERIATSLRTALDRSDAVIVCGGLGPTQDDITRDVIADVMGVELVEDPEVVERLAAMFGGRGREMPANNLRQALVPVGATRIPQQPGTAPGLICPVGDKVVFAVPGVPYEMKEMVAGTVIPELRAAGRRHRRHPQPHRAHLGPQRVGDRRDARRAHRRARSRRPGQSSRPSRSWPAGSRA